MKSMKVLGVLALTMATGIGLASGANGITTTCLNDRVCFFADSNFQGEKYQVKVGNTVIDIGGWYNDRGSSWDNTSGQRSRWYQHAAGAGTCHTMPAETQKAALQGPGENDSLSSFATNGACPGE